MNHCWMDRREAITEEFGFGSDEWVATHDEGWLNGTCMLEEGHEGPHEFTPDRDIGIRFVDTPSSADSEEGGDG